MLHRAFNPFLLRLEQFTARFPSEAMRAEDMVIGVPQTFIRDWTSETF